MWIKNQKVSVTGTLFELDYHYLLFCPVPHHRRPPAPPRQVFPISQNFIEYGFIGLKRVF